jgi:nicotinate-nucleotide adenylyltransferase
MCRLAVAGDPFFAVDDREARRPGTSYTFDTAAELAAETGRRVAWLIGTDLLARLHSWHRFDELVEAVDLVVMRRAGHPIPLEGLHPRVAALAEKAVVVPAIEISATMIRTRIAAGLPVADLVSAAVARYVANDGIYRTTQ